MAKKALIFVELLDECGEISNGEIAQELLRWFMEDASAVPWVKKFHAVKIHDV
jgi:hypothetical protein